MAKKIEVSLIRIEQFNDMVGMLRTIRTLDVRKEVAELKRKGHSREKALEMVLNNLQTTAKRSRGIAEIRKEASNGLSTQ